MSVGRNDPCPCGSGKKYKKCCMENVVPLTGIIDNELEKLPKELYEFAQARYEDEIHMMMESELKGLDTSEEEEDFLYLLLITWFIFSVPVTSGSTILEQFIQEKEKEKAVRTTVLQQLKNWKGIHPSFATVTSDYGKQLIEVEDVFTQENKNVQLDQEEEEIEVGGLLLGYLLPIGSYHAYLPMGFDFPAESTEDLMSAIFEAYESSDYSDAGMFMSANFPDYIKWAVSKNKNTYLTDIEWENPLYKLVADTYEKKVKELGEYASDYVKGGLMLWNVFCRNEKPSFRKPAVYAAALHYFVDMNFPSLGIYTQKELAEVYGVSSTAVSKAYRKLEEGLEEEKAKLDEFLSGISEEEAAQEQPFNRVEMEKAMREATKAIEGKNFDSLEEMTNHSNDVLNQPGESRHKSESTKEQAEELLYEAYETTGQERLNLAEQALKLHPDHADAYNIIGEEEPNPAEALKHFKKGMEAGERELGSQYFQENKGDFWGLVETRPFMRAKYNYTFGLIRLGRLDEAIEQMEELLELNRMDNQGVRDSLFAAYAVTGAYQKARQLLDKYPDEGMASTSYNRVLIEYYLQGISSDINKLLKKAKRKNPYVIDYLVGKKPLPDQLPDEFHPGDEKEAAIYAAEHIVLWEKEEDLMEWLKKRG